ncbi:MAG TPA: transglutaminase N-terminal domain-containing protein, partial [Polyangiaceae bacterium]|nr:transglutaminase N-terminal domain-containing protein [Polyangiaceae bacterium]
MEKRVRYRVVHGTTYEYSEAVSICHNEARLVPRPTPLQRPGTRKLSIEPTAAVLTEDTDYFGNVVHFFTLQEAHTRLSVTADFEVDLTVYEPPELANSPAWDVVADAVLQDRTAEGLAALEYTFESP